MMLAPPPPATSKFQGILEKRSSDGTWVKRKFSVHKHMLNYHDPGADAATGRPQASFDLLDVERVEIVPASKGKQKQLHLRIDERRKHVFRACDESHRPTVDEWAQELEERIDDARRRMQRMAHREAPLPAVPKPPPLDQVPPHYPAAAAATTKKKREGSYRDRIVDFYKQHNPAKVKDVDDLIAKYRDLDVSAKELYEAIFRKYVSETP